MIQDNDRYWILYDLFKETFVDHSDKKIHEYVKRRLRFEETGEKPFTLEDIYNTPIPSDE